MDKTLGFVVASLLITMALGGCEENAVGLASDSKITDVRFVASSARNYNTTPPRNGRLNYTEGSSWCTLQCDTTPYLQVDLGSVYIICGVATQGNSQADEWVQTYQVTFSKDGTGWSTHIELGNVQTFQGNFDRNTVVKRLLYNGFEARFVRIYPKLYYKAVCLRLELYGLSKRACSKTKIGVSNATKVPNSRFSASSEYSDVFAAPQSRLGSGHGWAPKNSARSNSWLQIDLGDVYFVCAVLTAGHGSGRAEFTKEYKVRLSVDNSAWHFYKEGGNDRVFQGNSDATSEITNVLRQEARAKLIQIWPTSFKNDPTLRLEIFGISLVSQASFGLADGARSKFPMKASSGTPENGLIYGGLAWCGDSLQLSPEVFLQVDLQQKSTITGLATQGNPSSKTWVISFSVKYSGDGNNWQNYKENQENKMTFPGNMDQNSIRVTWFNFPLFARYIRVYPQIANGNPCLRIDLFGDRSSLEPIVRIHPPKKSLRFGLESAELECHVHGQPEVKVIWEINNSREVLNISVNSSASGSVNGITISRLHIQSMNISEVLEQYTCLAFSRTTCTIRCSSPDYFCKARYADGPFAVQSTVVNRELDVLPPISVAVTDIQKESITLEWREPPLLGKSILGYVVHFVGDKSYNKTFIHKGEKITRSPTKTKLKVTNLKPGTRYRFHVATNAGCGKALYSEEVEGTTNFGGPPPPRIPYIIKEQVSSTSINIPLWQAAARNGPISSYQVIVLWLREKVNSLPHDYSKKLKDITRSKEANLNFYVTMEIPADKRPFPAYVTVGDGEVYGSYLNSKLERGKTYKLFMRAMTRVNGVTYHGKHGLLAQFRVDGDLTPRVSSTLIKKKAVFGIVGLLALLLLLIVIISTLSIIKIRRMKKTKDSYRENFQMLARAEPRQEMQPTARYSRKPVPPEPVGTYEVPTTSEDYGEHDHDQDSSMYYNKSELSDNYLNDEAVYEPVG